MKKRDNFPTYSTGSIYSITWENLGKFKCSPSILPPAESEALCCVTRTPTPDGGYHTPRGKSMGMPSDTQGYTPALHYST